MCIDVCVYACSTRHGDTSDATHNDAQQSASAVEEQGDRSCTSPHRQSQPLPSTGCPAREIGTDPNGLRAQKATHSSDAQASTRRCSRISWLLRRAVARPERTSNQNWMCANSPHRSGRLPRREFEQNLIGFSQASGLSPLDLLDALNQSSSLTSL